MEFTQQTVRAVLNKVLQSLEPFIGMTDPRRFGWYTSTSIGYYDGDKWTTDQHQRFNALWQKLYTITGLSVTKDVCDAGTTYTVRSNGLFKPLKLLPPEIWEFANGLTAIFTIRNPEITRETFIYPIEIYIGGNRDNFYIG